MKEENASLPPGLDKELFKEEILEYEKTNPGYIPFEGMTPGEYSKFRDLLGVDTPWNVHPGQENYMSTSEDNRVSVGQDYWKTPSNLKTIEDYGLKASSWFATDEGIVSRFKAGQSEMSADQKMILNSFVKSYKDYMAAAPDKNVPMSGISPKAWPGVQKMVNALTAAKVI